jgi:hypothetical protein
MRRILISLALLFFGSAAVIWAGTLRTRSGPTAGHAAHRPTPPAHHDHVLFGDKSLEPSFGRDAAGAMKAVRFRNSADGTARSISVYVAAGSQAKTLVAGLYTSRAGGIGRLLASGRLAAPRTRTWNRTVGMQSLINIVRGTGATNVIQVPGLAYANMMACNTGGSPTSCEFLDASDGIRVHDTLATPQLMGDVDVYPDGNVCGSTACYNATYAPVIAKCPLRPAKPARATPRRPWISS